ncbi:hypothetical protein TrCOL_g6144 [Triparma columacea]|uniref:Kinesin motor domain-containing protein n=1 Tax=Triparma columacea TaxID=722753 RepID=A0A9W7L4T7_9STRA|nr:hypothetical protein TrCOL_g6144 [Triparma columacea]
MPSVTFSSCLRIRPLKQTEIDDGERETIMYDPSNPNTVHVETNTTTTTTRSSSGGSDTPHIFHYDNVLSTSSTQSSVYSTIGSPIVANALSPTPSNSVLFSFGVSNSGKTYTLMGPSSTPTVASSPDSRGLIPRVVEGLFSGTSSLSLTLSVLEVYNDQIYDLLPSPSSALPQPSTPAPSTPSRRSSSLPPPPPKSLKIHQDKGGFYVHNLSAATFTEPTDALKSLEAAMGNNTTSATKMNSGSSRGHTVVILSPSYPPNCGVDDEPGRQAGQIMLVDMAGLERTKKSSVFGKSMRESSSINQSISNVTSVLKALKHNNKRNNKEGKGSKRIVPWRESKLTMLLQPVLEPGEGDTTVTMLVSAYAGGKDLAEKVGLMKEVESLRGIKIKGEKTTGRGGIVSRVWGRRQEREGKEQEQEQEGGEKKGGGEEGGDKTKKDDKKEKEGQGTGTPKANTTKVRRSVNSPAAAAMKKRTGFVDAKTAREITELRNMVTEREGEIEGLKSREGEWGNERAAMIKERNELRRERDSALAEAARLRKEVVSLNKDLKAERGINDPMEDKAAREARLKKQSLLGSPLKDHMNAVINSTALKDNNGRAGFKGLKGFKLSVPTTVPKKPPKREREDEEGGERRKIYKEGEDEWVNCM